MIGSRYIDGGETLDTKKNIFLSKILNFVYARTLGIKAKDASSNFRMYKTKPLK